MHLCHEKRLKPSSSKKTQKHNKILIKTGWYDSWSLLKPYNRLQFPFCVPHMNNMSKWWPFSTLLLCLSSLNHGSLDRSHWLLIDSTSLLFTYSQVQEHGDGRGITWLMSAHLTKSPRGGAKGWLAEEAEEHHEELAATLVCASCWPTLLL